MVIIWPMYPDVARWRFATIGLLGDRLALPALGLFTAILSATILEHRAVQGTLAGLSLLTAPTLAGLAIVIGLDGLELRNTVREDVLWGYDRSLARTVLLLLYAAVVAGALGWAALKVRRKTGSHRSESTRFPVRRSFAKGPGA